MRRYDRLLTCFAALRLLQSASACGTSSVGAAPRGIDAGDAPNDAPSDVGSNPADAGTFTPLGVYSVNVDGTALHLVVDPGKNDLTHVRQQAGSDWLTATRYTVAGANGYAMEQDGYLGTEILAFRLSDPTTMQTIVQCASDKICANSSWTDNGKLIWMQQDDPTNPAATRIKRASFAPVPTVTTIDAIPLPEAFVDPSDPHQVGPSDAGTLVFPALWQDPTGWMHPVFRVSAAGTTNPADVAFVGCPICDAACCAWPMPGDVVGATDPRMNHSGTYVIWMQQNPNVSFGSPAMYPFRQQGIALPTGTQTDLTQPGIAPSTSQSFIDWREDDAEGVYWTVEAEVVNNQPVIHQKVYRMSPDGSQRTLIALPSQLCASHPSYLSLTAIVFSAWSCGAPGCSCDATNLN
jgi:hypothetical protein